MSEKMYTEKQMLELCSRMYTEKQMLELCSREYKRGVSHGRDAAFSDGVQFLKEIHNFLHAQEAQKS